MTTKEAKATLNVLKNANTYFDSITKEIGVKTAQRYTLTDTASALFLEDANLTVTQAQEMLTSIFVGRLINDALSFTECYNDIDNNDFVNAIYKMTQDCLKDGDNNEKNLFEDWVNSAMRYCCYEPWEFIYGIVENFSEDNDTWFNKDTFGKTVQYLYDYYAVEELEEA